MLKLITNINFNLVVAPLAPPPKKKVMFLDLKYSIKNCVYS